MKNVLSIWAVVVFTGLGHSEERPALTAAEIESALFERIVNTPQEVLSDPLKNLKDEDPAIRYQAIVQLDPNHSSEHAKALEGALDDESPWLRYSAAVVLAQLRTDEIDDRLGPVLIAGLAENSNRNPGCGVGTLWGSVSVSKAVLSLGESIEPLLLDSLDSDSPILRSEACGMLVHMSRPLPDTQAGKSQLRATFLEALNRQIDSGKHSISRSMFAVARFDVDGNMDAVASVIEEDLSSADPAVRLAAIDLLAQTYTPARVDQILPLIEKALADDDISVAVHACGCMWELDRYYEVDLTSLAQPVTAQFEREMTYVQAGRFSRVMRKQIGLEHCPLEPLIVGLAKPGTRNTAIDLFGYMGSQAQPVLSQLQILLKHPHEETRRKAGKAVSKITESVRE